MSAFGAGYATCWFQFLNHRARLDSMVRRYAAMGRPDLFDEASAVEMWANGASDHLYDLHHPRRGVPRAEWMAALALASRAIDIGHGFLASSKSDAAEAGGLLTQADFLLGLLRERGHEVSTLAEAMATDQALGLRPDRGETACEHEVPR